MNAATHEYIKRLTCLKVGDLGLLRTHAGQGLDESLEGFDLFTGLWWPLRQKNQRAPRRSTAWLIAKLYAFQPVEHGEEQFLASQLRRCEPREERERKRFRNKFDALLRQPLERIEPALQWAIREIASNPVGLRFDWVQLTDDLSIWEREETRLKWAEQYLEKNTTGLPPVETSVSENERTPPC
ncbi:MAG TPA: type I-E CRISPR-associated protein Cse2/CasB [Candidatus Sumerlaeota bacterium]|nr:type I-E CRISPR-associated protein Cse2/CasB [Candidatus Sumerlaeota bacterium]HPS00672.1 type I-E CRISPR-associated protein Cse2/CasB [Candidatus Sumerlaeota bacterium]